MSPEPSARKVSWHPSVLRNTTAHIRLVATLDAPRFRRSTTSPTAATVSSVIYLGRSQPFARGPGSAACRIRAV